MVQARRRPHHRVDDAPVATERAARAGLNRLRAAQDAHMEGEQGVPGESPEVAPIWLTPAACVGADSAREFANSQLVTRVLQALAIASHLGNEDGHLVAKGRRFGVDAVGAADGKRVLVTHGQVGQDLL